MGKPKYYRISYNTYSKEYGLILHKKMVNAQGLKLYLRHFKQGNINELLIENWEEGMTADNLEYIPLKEGSNTITNNDELPF